MAQLLFWEGPCQSNLFKLINNYTLKVYLKCIPIPYPSKYHLTSSAKFIVTIIAHICLLCHFWLLADTCNNPMRQHHGLRHVSLHRAISLY